MNKLLTILATALFFVYSFDIDMDQTFDYKPYMDVHMVNDALLFASAVAVTGPMEPGGQKWVLARPVSIRSNEIASFSNGDESDVEFCVEISIVTTVSKTESNSDKTHWKSSREVALSLKTNVQIFGSGVEVGGARKVRPFLLILSTQLKQGRNNSPQHQ